VGIAIRRLRLGDFFSRMWVEYARRPRSFPPAVLRNRFLVPEWVFIFGIGRLLKQTHGRRPAGPAERYAAERSASVPFALSGASSMLMLRPS
jgi:hypothetical protein